MRQDDLIEYDGWVRCVTDNPEDGKDVLVTDGTEVWMGDYNRKRQGSDKWAVVYDGGPLVKSDKIIAWRYKPSIPINLITSAITTQ